MLFPLQQFRIRKEIKSHIKHGLSEDELQSISFTPELSADMIWMKDHEFSLHGEMFDIVYRDTCPDGSIQLYCINDKQEKVLFEHLDDLVRKSTRHDDPASRTASQLFQVFSFYVAPPTPELTSGDYFSSGFAAAYVWGYMSPDLHTNCPPPWFCFPLG